MLCRINEPVKRAALNFDTKKWSNVIFHFPYDLSLKLSNSLTGHRTEYYKNMELEEDNDLDERVLNATFGLKMLQIFMTLKPERIESDWNIGSSREESNFVECISKTPHELFIDLDNGKYIRYSSIMIIIDRVELSDMFDLKMLLKRIEYNQYLRYTPIFIICEYGIDSNRDDRNEVLDNYLNNIQGKYPGTRGLDREDLIYPNNFGQHAALWDDNYVRSREVDNVMLMQLFDLYEWYEYLLFMTTILSNRSRTIAEALKCCDVGFEYTVVPGSDDKTYFFNINPTLAIIINNYHFTSPLSIREGSELDVVHLIREFKLDKTPYIVIEDSDREKLLAVLKFLQKTDFTVLKRLMIFVMSHGEDNNTILTHDGKLNGDLDVVQRVLSNSSLKHVQTKIIFVHCRGDTDIDMEEVTPDLLQSIKPTDGKNLTNNTTIIYSTPATMVSYRWPHIGTPAVLSFCKNYRKMIATDTMSYLWHSMEEDIKKIDLFAELTNCTEMVSGAAEIPQIVKTTRIAAPEMLKLLNHFLKYFPAFPGTYFSPGGLFNVITFLNESKFPKMDIVDLYNSPDLDDDISKADDVCPKLRELQNGF